MGDNPLPSFVARSQTTAHGRLPRAEAQASLVSGHSDMLRIMQAVASSEIQAHVAENQRALVEVSAEDRMVTDNEINKVAQQLDAQGVQISALVTQGRADVYAALNMASHFQRQSQVQQFQLMDRVQNQLAVIQKDQTSALVQVANTFMGGLQQASKSAADERAHMLQVTTHATEMAAGRAAAQQQLLLSHVGKAQDHAHQVASQAAATHGETTKALTSALANVVTRPVQSKSVVVRPTSNPKAARFAGGPGSRMLTARPVEAMSPREVVGLIGPARPAGDPVPLQVLARDVFTGSGGSPPPRREGMAATIQDSAGGGMGLALVAGAAVVALAFANS